MPDPAYRVAREVARQVARELKLAPPFDIERVAARFARVVDEDIPTHADVIVLHARRPGDAVRIVVDSALRGTPERRRFAIAHGLAHVLLGWHPLGTPCDVTTRPHELPVTVHDLVEGEANAVARELLLPAAWIASFDALDRPAELMRHVAERGGVFAMPAARAVSLQLPAGYVWVVTDRWGRVLDAGRSPGTSVRVPAIGDELESGTYARHAIERHRDTLAGTSISVWRFDEPGRGDAVPRDLGARMLAHEIADDLGLGTAGGDQLSARIDGIAGWANEQLGTASLDGMRSALDARARTIPELAAIAEHPRYEELLATKATELVAKRLAR